MTDPENNDDRRRHRRFELRLPVTLIGAVDQPTSRDLSEGGMFIETRVPRQVGVVMPIRLVHPETGEVIPAVCQVVRQVHDDAGQLLGLGLRFANTDESLGDRIRRLIQDLIANADADADGDAKSEAASERESADDETESSDDAIAVVEFDEPGVSWETDEDGDGVLIVETEIADGAEHHPANIPIIWPDTQPDKIPGALRHGLTPMQLRLLAFIDGNNTVEEVAQGAGLGLEAALSELSDMARRAVIRIPAAPATEEDLIAWEESTESPAEPSQAKPLFPGREEHAAEQQRWRRARSLVTQGLAAERNDDVEDAVSLLEQALELNPPNAANIHTRIAVLGMEHVGDLDLAEKHARAAEALEPHRPHGRRLLRRIKRLRVRGVKPVKKKKKKPPRGATQQRRPERKKAPQARTSRRALAGLVLAIVLAGLIGWNVYRYLMPMLDAPPSLDVTELATLVPALEARIRSGKLVVTTSDAWDSLTDMEKTDRLERLAAWARENHGVREVLVADQTPLLRARAGGGVVKLFAPR